MAKGRLMTRATFRGDQVFDVDRYPRGDFPQIHSGGCLNCYRVWDRGRQGETRHVEYKTRFSRDTL